MQPVAKRCDSAPGCSRIRPRTSGIGANTMLAPPVHRRLPALPCGHGDSHAARPCRRRNAAARSRPQCRQRHRCSLRSIRRFSGVSGCPLPQWLGISSRRNLRRSILGKWTTAVLLVQSTPPLPTNRTFPGLRHTDSVMNSRLAIALTCRLSSTETRGAAALAQPCVITSGTHLQHLERGQLERLTRGPQGVSGLPWDCAQSGLLPECPAWISHPPLSCSPRRRSQSAIPIC
jgi:hypothetical protein